MSRRPFTLEEKLKICSRISAGEKNRDLSLAYDVTSSTISTIWKNRDKWLNEKNRVSRVKRIRAPMYENVDNALFQWFEEQRVSDVPLNGIILQKKANDLAKILGLQNFECSLSWIQRFRERHGIVFKKASDKAASAHVKICEDWIRNKWPRVREGYKDDDIFSADEAGIFYRLTPEKTFRLKDEKCIGGKLSKKRITVLVAANMSGTEKRPLVVIGNSKKPRCFLNVKRLPVSYEYDKRAWMTSRIFERILTEWDTELRERNRKILLLVDDCISHCSLNLENICLEFLPPNTSSVLQPMDQGVILRLKSNYRTFLVLKMIENAERKLKTKVTLLDAIIMLCKSWDDIPASTIANCFIHSRLSERPPVVDENVSDKLEEILPMVTSVSVPAPDFIGVDDHVITAGAVSNLDVVTLTEDSDSSDDEGKCVETTHGPCPTIAEARAALTILQTFCMANEEDVTCLKNLEDRLEVRFHDHILKTGKRIPIEDK